jgi:hypothetical protein
VADSKISDLTALTGGLATTDELVIVDKSDTTMAASGTDKRVTYATLLASSPVETGLVMVSAPASTATGTTNQWYAQKVWVSLPRSITGVRYRVGATQSGNQRCALYDLTGVKVADRTTDQTGGVANQFRNLAFDAPVDVSAGSYFILAWFASATATFFGGRSLVITSNGTQATTTPASITPPTAPENADRPFMTIY